MTSKCLVPVKATLAKQRRLTSHAKSNKLKFNFSEYFPKERSPNEKDIIFNCLRDSVFDVSDQWRGRKELQGSKG
jgi:hypothetical protein